MAKLQTITWIFSIISLFNAIGLAWGYFNKSISGPLTVVMIILLCVSAGYLFYYVNFVYSVCTQEIRIDLNKVPKFDF